MLLGVDPARHGADRSVYVSIDELGNVFDVTVMDRKNSRRRRGGS